MIAPDDDLSAEALAEALPDREIRAYPSIVSTEADAMAWSRAGAPEGALVVAGYQVSARARPRRPWRSSMDGSLSFTLILRPKMPPLRAGVLYLAATAGIAQAVGEGATIDWPDEVSSDGALAAHVSVHREMNVRGLEWALVNVMLVRAQPPRAPLLGRVVTAVEAMYRLPAPELLEAWSPLCRTVGRTVDLGLYPIGAGRRAEGRATSVRASGTLVVEAESGREHAVSPFDLMSLDYADTWPAPGGRA